MRGASRAGAAAPVRLAVLIVVMTFVAVPGAASERPWTVALDIGCDVPEDCGGVLAGFSLETAGGEVLRSFTFPAVEAADEISGGKPYQQSIQLDFATPVPDDPEAARALQALWSSWQEDMAGQERIFLVPFVTGCDGDTVAEEALELTLRPVTHRRYLEVSLDDESAGDCRVVAVRTWFEIDADDRLRVFDAPDGELAFENTGEQTLHRCESPTDWFPPGRGGGPSSGLIERFWPEHRPEIAPGETLMFPRPARDALMSILGIGSPGDDGKIALRVQTSGWTRWLEPPADGPEAPPMCDLLRVTSPLSPSGGTGEADAIGAPEPDVEGAATGIEGP